MSALHRALGAPADAAGGDEQLGVLRAVLRTRLGERGLAGAAAFLLPRLARFGLRGEHVACSQRPVVLVVLLGVEAGAATATATATAAAATRRTRATGPAGRPRRLLARPEPRLTRLGP